MDKASEQALPVDKETTDLLSPLLEMTQNNQFNVDYGNQIRQDNRIRNSGKTGSKRCVSETKKKYVASSQGWKCATCAKQLKHTFQVDHRIDLQFGGTNEVENLEALCNDCHAEKTARNYL